MVRVRQVGYDRRLRATLCNMQHIAFIDALAAVPARVGVVAHFQHAAPDVVTVAGEESLDVVTVDGRSAVKPEDAAEGREPPQITEPDLAGLGRQVAPAPPGSDQSVYRFRDYAPGD